MATFYFPNGRCTRKVLMETQVAVNIMAQFSFDVFIPFNCRLRCNEGFDLNFRRIDCIRH